MNFLPFCLSFDANFRNLQELMKRHFHDATLKWHHVTHNCVSTHYISTLGKQLLSIMADLKSDQKKALARDIYLLGSFTYEEIAQKVGTQRQTISRWAKQGGWDDLKAGMSVTREEILKRLYQQLNNINAIILERDPKERFANSKEADAMAKLSATIKNMEIDVGISDIISVGMRFGEWLRRVDLDKAKEYVQYWDLFLKEQIK
jgi:hypothetical protein